MAMREESNMTLSWRIPLSWKMATRQLDAIIAEFVG